MHRFVSSVRVSLGWLLRLSLLFAGQHAFALGYVDSASLSGGQLRITGWACDSANRNVATAIHVRRDDNILLGGGIAPNLREAAVGAACSSTNSNHGFDITIQLGSSTLDNKSHLVRIYSVGPTGNVEEITPATNTNLMFANGTPVVLPKNQGDIVGRDLRGVIGSLGHLGFWDGRQVIEVMNESKVVQKNSYDSFSSKSPTWNPISTNIPNFSIRTCYQATCDWQSNSADRVTLSTRSAMANRAYQIFTIGADYTAMSYAKYAVPSLYDASSRRTTPAVRGTYRCDTFVLDLFGFTNIPSGYGSYFMWGDSRGISWPLDRVISGDPQSWKTNINLLFTATTMLPPSVFARIKTF